jgi:hypothetical protein
VGGVSINRETQNPYDCENGLTEASADSAVSSFLFVSLFVLIFFGIMSGLAFSYLIRTRPDWALEFAKPSGHVPYTSLRHSVRKTCARRRECGYACVEDILTPLCF